MEWLPEWVGPHVESLGKQPSCRAGGGVHKAAKKWFLCVSLLCCELPTISSLVEAFPKFNMWSHLTQVITWSLWATARMIFFSFCQIPHRLSFFAHSRPLAVSPQAAFSPSVRPCVSVWTPQEAPTSEERSVCFWGGKFPAMAVFNPPLAQSQLLPCLPETGGQWWCSSYHL